MDLIQLDFKQLSYCVPKLFYPYEFLIVLHVLYRSRMITHRIFEIELTDLDMILLALLL